MCVLCVFAWNSVVLDALDEALDEESYVSPYKFENNPYAF